MRCKVHWHGVQCERAQGHTRKHTFVLEGERVKKSGSQVLQSAQARKACNTSDKKVFRDLTHARLACAKWKLAKDLDLVPYFCTCGKFHLTSRYTDREKETV